MSAQFGESFQSFAKFGFSPKYLSHFPISGSENNTAEKKRRRLSVEINGSNVASSVSSGGKTEDDAGFISLPHTPTDLGLNLDLKIATSGNSVASSVHSGAFSSQFVRSNNFHFSTK